MAIINEVTMSAMEMAKCDLKNAQNSPLWAKAVETLRSEIEPYRHDLRFTRSESRKEPVRFWTFC